MISSTKNNKVAAEATAVKSRVSIKAGYGLSIPLPIRPLTAVSLVCEQSSSVGFRFKAQPSMTP